MSLFNPKIYSNILEREYISGSLGISPWNINISSTSAKNSRLILMNNPCAADYQKFKSTGICTLDAIKLKEVCENLGIRKIEAQIKTLNLRCNTTDRLNLRGLSIMSGSAIHIMSKRGIELDHCDLTTVSDKGAIIITTDKCNLSCSGLSSGSILIEGHTIPKKPRIHANIFLGICLSGPTSFNRDNLWDWLGDEYKIYKPEGLKVPRKFSANISIIGRDGSQKMFMY